MNTNLRSQSSRSLVFLTILASFIIAFTVVSRDRKISAGERQDAPGAVYTMTNAVVGNAIWAFNRSADGSLTPAGAFPTGGTGSGGSLGNQGGLVLSHNNRWLFAVNAGSHEISVFEVKPRGLRWVDKVDSGGLRPISVTIHGDLLYVLNAGGLAGGSDNITGFLAGHDGKLSSLPGSTRPLSAASTGPAQIEFAPQGRLLVVTEKATNIIDTYSVDKDGMASLPNVQFSEGQTPFGFAFGKRNQLFVSEAFGGGPGASTLSSYSLSQEGVLQTISSSVPTTQTAACWTVITNDGRLAFVSNTGSATISSYQVGFDGVLSLLKAVAANTGGGPIDMALSNNSRFFYVLNGTGHSIGAYRVELDGSLTPVSNGVSGLPAGANGLAAR